MRVNVRKLILICGTLAFLWVVVSYSSTFVPSYNPRNRILELEAKITRLEHKMQDQLSDGYKLLEKARKHFEKTEEKHVEDSDKDSQSILNEEAMKCKYFL